MAQLKPVIVLTVRFPPPRLHLIQRTGKMGLGTAYMHCVVLEMGLFGGRDSGNYMLCGNGSADFSTSIPSDLDFDYMRALCRSGYEL